MTGSESPFHRGEKAIQARLGVDERIERLGERMIQPRLAPAHREFLAELPTLLVASADEAGRPWASVLAGAPGFVSAPDAGRLRIGARPLYGDPLQRHLSAGAPIGTLGLHFPTRTRLRVNGTVAAVGDDGFDLDVAQAYGNCDMYIQTRDPGPSSQRGDSPGVRPVRRGESLDRAEAALIARSDTFFIASQAAGTGTRSDGMDLSHRGGRPGFVIVAHETLLLFPDYPGNCMFNTLGNLQLDPRAGLLFLDFHNGDTLQLSGRAEVLWEPHHVNRFPGAERVVAFSVEETLRVTGALPLSWDFGEYSPVMDTFDPPELVAASADTLPPARLLSINLSLPRDVVHEDRPVSTGIFKEPASGRVMLRHLNLDGDGQADLWGHGGAFRAVYVYPHEHYEYWRRELARDDFACGQFGENFTIEGLLEEQVQVGDVFRIGNALVEVSQPRVPCFKLAMRMGIENFQNQFLRSGRIGFYLRVLEPGEVGAGDALELVGRDPNGMSVRKMSDLLFFNTQDLDATRQALAIRALSHGWKGSFEERLAQAPAAGQGEAFREFTVTRREEESDTITSFYLQPADGGSLWSFRPGQFLTFELPAASGGEPLLRTYSLSDSPDRDYYRVSIKREAPPADDPTLAAGVSSSFFHDRVQPGTKLRVGAPRGRFCLDGDSERTLVLLSAGVGITPLLSMVSALARSGTQRRVWFIHGARSGREHAFGPYVRRLAAENDNVRVHVRYSAPVPGDVAGRDYDSRGHVDVALLKELLPFDDYEFYMVGPTPFMRSLYCGLSAMGVAADRIHYEFFGPAAALVDEAPKRGGAESRDARDELAGDCRVVFARSGVEAQWTPDCETLLDLAEHQGLHPPYSCRSGICRTCMCELREGEVEYVEQPLTAPDPGKVLICVARPTTGVVIDV